MKSICIPLLCACLLAMVPFPATMAEAEKRKPTPATFLDNGEIRLGVDLDAGGSIFHFSKSGEKSQNLLNHYDKGRFIQQSYYGQADGSLWNGKPWRWNPVQGGGYRGEPAEVIENERKGQILRIVSIPKHWATGKAITEARMSSEITLQGPIARLDFTFTYKGEVKHPPTHQEVPAVFIDAAFSQLVRYEGKAPWTDAEISRTIPGWPNERVRADENWAAYLNENGQGIGVFFPGTHELTTYRFKGDGKQGPTGSACSYFAPIRTFAITPGMVFTYSAYLTLGSEREIRARFKQIHKYLIRAKDR
jgi:hypothetical protein